MGGSGGGYFSSRDTDALLRQLEKSTAATDDREYEIEALEILNSTLSNYNDRDVEDIRDKLQTIRNVLESEIEGTLDLVFGGSVSKHTYVEGLSDVDSLVLIDSCELAAGSPDAAKHVFASKLREQFGEDRVREGHLAVTVAFPGAEIQLLPAVRCGDAVKIRDALRNDWSEVRPREFARILTETNQQCGGKLIPVVKLAKGIIANLPDKQRISGYHAESLAVQLFRGYRGERNAKAMLHHYFGEAAKAVMSPVRDRTGQSVHVDDYLGPEGSLERRIASDGLARVWRRMRNADAGRRADEWRRLIGE